MTPYYDVVPGGLLPGPGDHILNAGQPVTRLAVANSGDRPVQVGSHYHFAEANDGLIFARQAALGQRLDVPAGTAVRFEPGETRGVDPIPLRGARQGIGCQGQVLGAPGDG